MQYYCGVKQHAKYMYCNKFNFQGSEEVESFRAIAATESAALRVSCHWYAREIALVVTVLYFFVKRYCIVLPAPSTNTIHRLAGFLNGD